MEGLERSGCRFLDRVGYADKACNGAVKHHKHDRFAFIASAIGNLHQMATVQAQLFQ